MVVKIQREGLRAWSVDGGRGGDAEKPRLVTSSLSLGLLAWAFSQGLWGVMKSM